MQCDHWQIFLKMKLMNRNWLQCNTTSVKLISCTLSVFLLVIIGKVPLSTEVGRYSDLLQAGRSGDRMPVEVKFSAPVQTVSGAHPARG